MDFIASVFGQVPTPTVRDQAKAIMEQAFAAKAHPGMKPNPARAIPPAIAPAPFADWTQYNQWQSGQHRVDPLHIGAGHIMGVFGL